MTNSTGTDSFSFRVSRKWEQWRIVFMCLWIHVMDPREWISQFLHLWNTINFWVERVSFWFQISYYMLHNLPLSLPCFSSSCSQAFGFLSWVFSFSVFSKLPCHFQVYGAQIVLTCKSMLFVFNRVWNLIRSSRFPNYRRPIWGDL